MNSSSSNIEEIQAQYQAYLDELEDILKEQRQLVAQGKMLMKEQELQELRSKLNNLKDS